MKYRLLIVFSIAFVFNWAYSYADEECSQSLGEAKALYNAGKYQAAKEMFEYVQKLCGSTYGSANTWIQKCDQAMNGGSKPASSPSPQQSSSPATTLSVSKTQIDVLGGSASEFISITSNKSWYIYSSPASWYKLLNHLSYVATRKYNI